MEDRGRRDGDPVNLGWGCGEGILEREFLHLPHFLFLPFGPLRLLGGCAVEKAIYCPPSPSRICFLGMSSDRSGSI